MAEDWSYEEVAATVADYFEMLGHELRREPYTKREHNRRLQAVLNGRSPGAIEFKHANISAVLIELGFPYVDGYKPRGNYQELLKTEVLSRLESERELSLVAQAIVDALVVAPGVIPSIRDVFVPAPMRTPAHPNDRKSPLPLGPRRINYLEQEARNASLGAAGELFVLQVEHQRLWHAGRRHLAEKVDHVSHSAGDGLGYDIVSFEEDGRERLIEVKTTTFGSMTPFFASAREVNVSETRAEEFHLYRVFKYREAPRIFTLRGSLRETCVLDPVEFRASLP